MNNYFKLKEELKSYGIDKYFDRRNTGSFDILFEETKKAGIMREKCPGCGWLLEDRDCGCPCGTSWGLSKKHIKRFKVKSDL